VDVTFVTKRQLSHRIARLRVQSIFRVGEGGAEGLSETLYIPLQRCTDFADYPTAV